MGQVAPREVKNLVSSKLTAPKHTFMSAATFRLSTRDAKVYALEISECTDTIGTTRPTSTSILAEYHNLHEAFSENASNELLDHGMSNMKIEFKEGQEPRNIGLGPMSLVELEELHKYLEENLGKGWI